MGLYQPYYHTTGGYQCTRCGQWVYPWQEHYCPATVTYTAGNTKSDDEKLDQILALLRRIAAKLGA